MVKEKHPKSQDVINREWSKLMQSTFNLWIYHYATNRKSKNENTDLNNLYLGAHLVCGSEFSYK